MSDESLEELLEGVLHFFSETGTEGGYWAFQDATYITLNTTRFSCTTCGVYWDQEKFPDAPYVHTAEYAGDISKYCPPESHDFDLTSKESWSYEGLHVLRDGDELTIYSPDDRREVWSGTIDLKQHPLFSEDAGGMWIHADQKGVDRETWAEYFFKGYPAQLRARKDKS